MSFLGLLSLLALGLLFALNAERRREIRQLAGRLAAFEAEIGARVRALTKRLDNLEAESRAVRAGAAKDSLTVAEGEVRVTAKASVAPPEHAPLPAGQSHGLFEQTAMEALARSAGPLEDNAPPPPAKASISESLGQSGESAAAGAEGTAVATGRGVTLPDVEASGEVLGLLGMRPTPQPSRPRRARTAATGASPAARVTAAASRPKPATAWLREQFRGAEWEAVIGGSWMNRLGAVVLVVGVVLLLGYSWAHMGAAGRVALGLVISGGMLAVGVIFERREGYVTFARGLIGGGWAALYFTTFAMHGLEAARVIDSPLAGSVALFAVAVGMVAHALRYRSQATAGLAFFVTFATLAISPATHFALFASVPVALALLYVAQRFEWSATAVAGVVFTYATFLLRLDSFGAGATGIGAWSFGQSLLIVYWVAFEAFDLLSVSRRRPEGVGDTLFPLNAAGFLGISVLGWNQASPGTLYVFVAAAGTAYLVSALIRARLLPPSSLKKGDPVSRVLQGSYEGAVTLAAALAALAILQRFEGWQQTVAWLLEAQLLLLSGLMLRQPFLRHLASAVLILPAVEIGRAQLGQSGVGVSGGWHPATPVAALAAGLLYIGRGLVRTSKTAHAAGLERGYTCLASILVMLIMAHEMPTEYMAVGWLLLGAMLLESSLRSGLVELRYQAYAVAFLAWGVLAVVGFPGVGLLRQDAWKTLLPAVVLSYGAAARLLPVRQKLPEAERRGTFGVASAAGTALGVLLVAHEAPAGYTALGWLVLGAALVEVALGSGLVELRRQGYAVALLAWGALVAGSLLGVGVLPQGVWKALLPAIALSYAGAARIWLRPSKMPEREGRDAFAAASAAGTALLALMIWHLLPVALVAPAWLVVGLALLGTGLRLESPALRYQGHVVLIAAFCRTFFANFLVFSDTAGISHRLLTIVPMIVAYYYVVATTREAGEAGALTRFERPLARLYTYLPAILAAVLLRFELGRTAAVFGWTVVALIFLSLGVRRNERDLRLQGYALAGLIFGRAWATNFYIPGAILGVDGGILAGVVVTAGLFAAHYLMPRRYPGAGARGSGSLDRLIDWLDSRARLALSSMATVLLSALLFYKVAGSWLTVAWGLEGTILLLAGFGLQDRQLRVPGLVMLGVCIFKAFLYDFSELETVFRILSFITLGVLLIAVSFVYSRYREQIRRLL